MGPLSVADIMWTMRPWTVLWLCANPSEKDARQIVDNFPNDRGENEKYLKSPPGYTVNPNQTAQHLTISPMKGCNPLTLSMSQLTGGQFNPRNLKNPYQSLLQSTPFSKHQAAPIVTCSSGKYPKTSRNMTSWWFQPIWKILVKMGIFPRVWVKITNIWNHHLDEQKQSPTLLQGIRDTVPAWFLEKYP